MKNEIRNTRLPALAIRTILFFITLTACSITYPLTETPQVITGEYSATPTKTNSIMNETSTSVPTDTPTDISNVPLDTPTPNTSEPLSERWYLMGRPGGEISGSYGTGSIKISTVNPDKMYLTLGEQGLLVSADGGRSWTNVWQDLLRLGVGYNVTEVLADPNEADKLYALVNDNLVVSKDLGRNWGLLLEGPIAAIGIGSDSETIYAISSKGFHTSKNQGQIWDLSPLNSPSAPNEIVARLAVDSNDPNTAYSIVNGLLMVTNSGGRDWTSPPLLEEIRIRDVISDRVLGGLAYILTEDYSLYRTEDGGKSWGLIANQNAYREPVSAATYGDPDLLEAWNGSIYIKGTGEIGKENSCDVLISGLTLFASNDKGASWKPPIPLPKIAVSCSQSICSRSVYSVAIGPDNSSHLYSIVQYDSYGPGGISFLISNDGGETWEMQEPLPVPSRIATSADGRVLHTSGNLISRSENGGESWQNFTSELLGCPVLEGDRYEKFLGIASNPNDPSNVYMTVSGSSISGANVLKTEDGGRGWVELDPPINRGSIGRIWINPFRSDYIYLGEPNLFSIDGGVQWIPWLPIEYMHLNAIAVNPSNPDHILLGLIDGGLYFSPDGGQSIEVRGLGGDFSVYTLAFDPSDAQRVYAVAEASNKVSLYRSDDEGITWNIISDLKDVGETVNYPPEDFYGTLLVHPKMPNILYLARKEVFFSDDEGVSWHLLATGMSPNENITGMVITSTTPPMLYTTGRSGVWKLILP
jgi:photosystem II stability/assembly factor-like uncharacterized protein